MFCFVLVAFIILLVSYPKFKVHFAVKLVAILFALLLLFGDSIKEKFTVQGHGVPLNVEESEPLKQDSMFLFSESKCSADCCKGRYTYSCDRGCVCQDDKLKYLSSRGGNN